MFSLLSLTLPDSFSIMYKINFNSEQKTKPCGWHIVSHADAREHSRILYQGLKLGAKLLSQFQLPAVVLSETQAETSSQIELAPDFILIQSQGVLVI